MPLDPAGRGYTLAIAMDRFVMAASDQAILEMVREEVAKQIKEDPEMRIPIREMVREAMGRINLSEVVQQEIQKAIAAAKEKAKDE